MRLRGNWPRALSIDYDEILRSRLLQILNPAEVEAVKRAGIDVELHTHRHRTPRDQRLFVKEVEDNRRRIIDLTGKNPLHFCYPERGLFGRIFWMAAALRSAERHYLRGGAGETGLPGNEVAASA